MNDIDRLLRDCKDALIDNNWADIARRHLVERIYAALQQRSSDMGSSAAFRCCGFSDTPCPSFAESCQNPRNYPCLRCKGAGSIEVDDTTSGPDGGRYEVACPACDGIGVRGFQREPNTPATNKGDLPRLPDGGTPFHPSDVID